MASRKIRKPTVPSVVDVTVFRNLPGALFFDHPIEADDLEYAARLQQIRSEYENDNCQEMLWDDLLQMGFDSSEIRKFVANPAAITDCGYGMPFPLR
jgi:hypothetical protein